MPTVRRWPIALSLVLLSPLGSAQAAAGAAWTPVPGREVNVGEVTGEWEVVGSMTVSADGRFVETDPGVGILAPGWHGTLPGAQGDGGPIFVCFPLPPVVICIPAPLLPEPDFPQECPSQ